MIKVDVVILSYTKNDAIFKMTKNCIDSIINSESNIKFRIFLVETDKTGRFIYKYPNITTIVPDGEFNYNKFLNIGLKQCSSEWILISNNDTIYQQKWCSNMLNIHNKDKELLSMSPLCPGWDSHQKFIDKKSDIHYGHETNFHLVGWSIFLNKSVISKIGYFDEQFPFWYQDNDYSMALIQHNIKHALITSSVVEHIFNQSFDLIKRETLLEYTLGSEKIFNKKWKKNQ